MASNISLEVPANEFLDRLSPNERMITKRVVRKIVGWLDEDGLEDYLISGVGGVLRSHNPRDAKDIDLAVVGLKYTPSDNLDRFFDDVTDFFDYLSENPLLRKRKQRIGGSGSCWVSGSGGCFINSPRTKITKKKLNPTIKGFNASKIILGPYNSLGFQVSYSSMRRPIDIQFVFNESPRQWEAKQMELKEDCPLLKSNKFLYAKLYESYHA